MKYRHDPAISQEELRLIDRGDASADDTEVFTEEEFNALFEEFGFGHSKPIPKAPETEPTPQPAPEPTPEPTPAPEPEPTIAPTISFKLTQSLLDEARNMSDDDLAGKLEQLVKAKTYLNVRDSVCALSVVMNERGQLAPGFRSNRPIPRKGQEAPEDRLVLRDLITIDLHWLHARGKRDQIPDKQWANLFTEESFDFDLAYDFASRVWKADVKVGKVLGLHNFEQLQTAKLREKALKDRVRHAEQSAHATIMRRLNEQACTEPQIRRFIGEWRDLWLADHLLDGAATQSVGQLYGWMFGKPPLADRTLRQKLATMRERTAPKSRR